MATIQERRRQIERSTAGAYPSDEGEPCWHPSVFDRLFYGVAIHFVGFKGDEYTAAVRIFGRPDFIHRNHDIRLVRGGELAPWDIVVFANGSEKAVKLNATDDSNIDVQLFEKAERSRLCR